MGDAPILHGCHRLSGEQDTSRQRREVRMTLIGLSSVEKFYGGRAVLRGLEMRVNAGARIGLVGGNGGGKSTVLRILAGTEEVDGGEVIRRRGLSVATLPQYIEGDERTPMEVVRAARPEISDLQTELEACEEQLGSPEVAADLRRMQRVLERQDRLLRRFTELGGPGFVGEARGYLRSLGLVDGDIYRPMRDLSGGQRKLAVLASCLARRSDVLLLDEPEAHLEEAIQRFKPWASMVVNERHIKQARNKQRQIDRMDKVERPVLERRKMGLEFRGRGRGGQKGIELKDVSVVFDDDPVLTGIDITVSRGE